MNTTSILPSTLYLTSHQFTATPRAAVYMAKNSLVSHGPTFANTRRPCHSNGLSLAIRAPILKPKIVSGGEIRATRHITARVSMTGKLDMANSILVSNDL